MAVPTRGRVILETTVGEIEIELWSKVGLFGRVKIFPSQTKLWTLRKHPKPAETSSPCPWKYLVTVSADYTTPPPYLQTVGYYDGVIFHRVVPGFLVQTGDRTGTGGGGESFYGDQFEDEVHPRLKFPHRGIVAMANSGEKDTNDSQFFITLDRADELYGKHTVFGRVVGNTIFNVMKIGEVALDKNERPIYPPKITSVRIVDNPFDDIVPRITAAEKAVQRKAREEAQREREEALRRKNAKKNVGLLSFGDTAEEEEAPLFKKKAIARPDLIENTATGPYEIPEPPASRSKPHVKSTSAPSEGTEASSKEKKSKGGSGAPSTDINSIREQHASEKTSESSARQAEIAKMEADIKRLARRQAGSDAESDDDDIPSKKKSKNSSALAVELAKYRTKGSRFTGVGGKKKKDEGDTLARLEKFKGKLKSSSGDVGRDLDDGEPTAAARPRGEDDGVDDDVADANEEENTMDIDTDVGFLATRISFPKSHDNSEETARAERDYEVIDPRARGAAAKEAEQDRIRKKNNSASVGRVFKRDGGGRDGYGGREREGDGRDDVSRKAFGKDAARDRPKDRGRERGGDRDSWKDDDFGKRKHGGW